MNILQLIGSIFKPATELVDAVHTSEEEKLRAKATLLELQTDFLAQGLEYEAKQMQAKADIIIAEAKSQHSLTSMWRPITMLGFLAVVLNNYVLVPYFTSFGWEIPALPIGDEMWQLLQIGIGGYIASRGVEKVVPAAVSAFKQREDT